MDIQQIASGFVIISGSFSFLGWALKQQKLLDMKTKIVQFWKSDKFLAISISVFILSSIFNLYLTFAQPSWKIITFQPRVYEPFEDVYKKYKSKLNDPIGEVKTTNSVYYAVHENANVIWLKVHARFYVLNDLNRKWTEYYESSWDLDPKWHNKKWLIERFQPPEGLDPPYAGVAWLWDRDPENWSWIGFKEWDCLHKNIYYQEFEEGMIIGNFLRHPSRGSSILFVLMDDFRWELEEAKMPEQICNKIAEKK